MESLYHARNQQELNQALYNGAAIQRTKVSPINIPEVLDQIFSYIDSLTTLRKVIAVCRQWFLMNRHRIIREVTWDGSWASKKLDAFLSKVPTAERVVWVMEYEENGDKKKQRQSDALVEALKTSHDLNLKRQQQQRDDQQRRPLFGTGLRSLKLIGHLSANARLASLLLFIPTLTSLQMSVMHKEQIYIDQILESCPKLTRLSLTYYWDNDYVLSGSWVPSSFSSHTQNSKDGEEESRDVGQSKNYQLKQQSLPLQSLLIHNFAVPQSSLESLLSITPALQHLKLMELVNVPNEDDHWGNDYDIPGFVNHICALTLNQKLRSFHFSHKLATMNDVHWKHYGRILTPEMFPKVSEWSFSGQTWEMYDWAIKPFLVSVSNTLTTLELVSARNSHSRYASASLHEYLCASPHLLHLKAPNTWFLLHLMDLHLREDIDKDSSDIRPIINNNLDIWACRNLRTLYMSVYRHNDDQDHTELEAPAHSRIIFGYLSRVCPRLQDLQIAAHRLYLELSGGMCLLARLKDLERLVVEIDERYIKAQAHDLSWMALPPSLSTSSSPPVPSSAPSSSSLLRSFMDKRMWKESIEDRRIRDQQERRRIIEGWKDRIQSDATKEVEYRGRIAVRQDIPANNDDDHELRHELRNLGLLLDVKSVLDEIDSYDGKDFYCWPALREMSFKDRLRPDNDKVGKLEQSFGRMVPREQFKPHRLIT